MTFRLTALLVLCVCVPAAILLRGGDVMVGTFLVVGTLLACTDAILRRTK